MSKANYGTNLNNLQGRAPHAPFIPSSEQLLAMIASAEAKFAAAREKRLCDRAYEAMAINARKARERREQDCRRYVNAGDKP